VLYITGLFSGDNMKKQKFIEKLAEILEVKSEELTNDFKLPEDIWDSLVILAVAAAFDEIYDEVVPVKKIEKCSVVGELFQLVGESDE